MARAAGEWECNERMKTLRAYLVQIAVGYAVFRVLGMVWKVLWS